ncbi:hypothetical protein [Natronolimnobius baerhuensis]|uniref:Uncharacterized protein n=1 Tax=Natronolimnobius baerhuensis TaxID=253108 RepID=A0A202E937_9EURY|nr:hypothetical protein [Natronolimnobius baerhuensis]OVE84761.1 hypothetical protein B2G88_10290 [Natronolimnobius baerhuensis]
MTPGTSTTTDSDPTSSDQRRLLGYGLAAIIAVTALSAGAGYAVQAWTGLEETTILAMPVAISPGSFALYGAVVSATFLVTLALVFYTVSMLERSDEFELE